MKVIKSLNVSSKGLFDSTVLEPTVAQPIENHGTLVQTVNLAFCFGNPPSHESAHGRRKDLCQHHKTMSLLKMFCVLQFVALLPHFPINERQ